jgi:hypothetical protein
MIAAIYARKSTEQNGVGDETKSVTRQIEHAKAYATKKGWAVAEDYVYADDGISGAEFIKRPGFLRLMNALKPKPPFQALISKFSDRPWHHSVPSVGTPGGRSERPVPRLSKRISRKKRLSRSKIRTNGGHSH